MGPRSNPEFQPTANTTNRNG
ncbi:hypothetical protein DSM3645_02783 [Blastopirellula marina DSM 3645]|uniref:Uncharacterized protein n=1 Tax=Blastopirellula marina DSM 3645 TaxID=314230 RepID=A3ZVM0_9BACT|nr:hypothetical protein DSM3645_02783 [Blastopirellula marina DSM 3645]